MATVTPEHEIAESIVPYQAPLAVTETDIESLRDTLVAVVQEDRERMLATIRDALLSRDDELSALRGQIAGLQTAFDRLRNTLESGELATTRVPATTGTGTPFDVDSVLNEIDEIERLLGQLQD